MHYLGRHKHIAKLLGWCDEPEILMNIYPLGSLESVIKSHYVNSKRLVFELSLDILRSIQFMHSKGVAHCDIKPANVLVEENTSGHLCAALTNFGISQVFTVNALLVRDFKVVNLRGVSMVYAAPEVVSRFRRRVDAKQEDAYAGDVYSAGMTMFYTINSKSPWSA